MSVPVVLRVRYTERWLDRMVGLLATSADGLDVDALAIAPCSAVHTIGMRYPIDLAFVGADSRVLRTERAVPPGRWVVSCRGAVVVLERPAGEECWPDAGETVHLEATDS